MSKRQLVVDEIINFEEGALERGLNDIAKLTSITCEAPVVLISLIGEEGLHVKSHFGLDPAEISLNNAIGISVMDTPGEILYVNDITKDIRFKDDSILKAKPKLVSYWGCPLMGEDALPLGVISILDERPKDLKIAQKDALTLFGAQVVNLLISRNRATQLRAAEIEIEKKDETIENIVACTESGTWEYDLETGELIFNEKWAELLGYTLSELGPIVFETWKSLVHPEDFEVASRNLVSFTSAKTKTYDVEFRMLHKNGVWKWIRSRGLVLEFSKNGMPSKIYGTHSDIDERKKVEIKVLKEKERFEYAARATSDILWDWDVRNDSIFFGDNYAGLFGFKPSNIDTEYSADWEQRLHPDERDAVVNSLRNALDGYDETWQKEYRFRKQDNTYAFVLDKAYIVRDEMGYPLRVVGAIQDLTLRKEAELQLKVFESIINKTKDSIIITKAEPIEAPSGPEIIYVNEAVVKKTGYSKEELIGDTPRLFQGPNTDRATLKYISDKLRNWEVIDVDIINYTKDNEEYWINLSIVPVGDEDGWYKYWISVQKDITDRKMYEKSLTELNEKLQKNAAELEISNEELKQFAYVTSHDLQEPLRMVTSFLTQLERKYSDVLDEKGKRYIHFAVDGAKRMRQLILDLLEYSRVGKTNEPREVVDLNLLLKEVIELNDRFINEKNAIVTINKLPIVNSFYSPLRQVLLNLINNALKYSTPDRIPEIRVSAKQTKRSVILVVEDNGIGIKKEYLEKIFVIFQRLHTKEEFSGTGIGLAISKKLMEHLGGKIWVESKMGKGSKFMIEIIKG